MRLSYRGIIKQEGQIAHSELPDNAVKFREPRSLEELNIKTFIYAIPLLIIIGAFVLLSYVINKGISMDLSGITVDYNFLISLFPYIILLILYSLVIALPHEFLHILIYKKEAKVEIYLSLKQLMLLSFSTTPISKRRYLWMAALPNLLLGWIPFFVWVFIPMDKDFGLYLFILSVLTILMGLDDYINIINVLTQMPKGSMKQNSGMYSYWYMPQNQQAGQSLQNAGQDNKIE